MKITMKQVGAVAVLNCAGKILVEEGVDTLRDFVSHLIAGGQNLILVNLSEVPFVDSSGVGEFVFALQTVEKAGGRLKLVNLQKWVEQRFRRVKLYDLFDVREDEAAALQSF